MYNILNIVYINKNYLYIGILVHFTDNNLKREKADTRKLD